MVNAVARLTSATMEYPPSSWFIFGAEDFNTAATRNPGEIGVEAMVQIRPNGRIQDHWRLATGGSKILGARILLNSIIPAAASLGEITLEYQCWPADINIRRNMTTSAWLDVADMVKTNGILARGADGELVDNAVITEALAGIKDKAANSASWRWAICIGEDDRLQIQLQCLPAPASLLGGKPVFKR